MTAIYAPPEPAPSDDHIILQGVSWGLYEKLLKEVGDDGVRMTYDDGELEIMAPLPAHERPNHFLGRFLEMLTLERDIPISGGGSTTFRRKDLKKGLEPDCCYWIANEEKVRAIKRWNPRTHPPPDLAIEIDITSRSIPRQPIYAALGVPELWRYDGEALTVLALQPNRTYLLVPRSPAFPFLPINEVERFLRMAGSMEENALVKMFVQWVRTLPRE